MAGVIWVVRLTQTWFVLSDHAREEKKNRQKIYDLSVIFSRYSRFIEKIDDLLPCVDKLVIYWRYFAKFSPIRFFSTIVLSASDTWYIVDISQHFRPWIGEGVVPGWSEKKKKKLFKINWNPLQRVALYIPCAISVFALYN